MRPYLLTTAVLGIVAMALSATRAEEIHGITCDGDECIALESGYQWALEQEVTAETECRRSPNRVTRDA